MLTIEHLRIRQPQTRPMVSAQNGRSGASSAGCLIPWILHPPRVVALSLQFLISLLQCNRCECRELYGGAVGRNLLLPVAKRRVAAPSTANCSHFSLSPRASLQINHLVVNDIDDTARDKGRLGSSA